MGKPNTSVSLWSEKHPVKSFKASPKLTANDTFECLLCN